MLITLQTKKSQRSLDSKERKTTTDDFIFLDRLCFVLVTDLASLANLLKPKIISIRNFDYFKSYI